MGNLDAPQAISITCLLVLYARTRSDDYGYYFLPSDLTIEERNNITFVRKEVVKEPGAIAFVSISERFDIVCQAALNPEEDNRRRRIESFVGLLFPRFSRFNNYVNATVLRATLTGFLNEQMRLRFDFSGRMPVLKPYPSPEIEVVPGGAWVSGEGQGVLSNIGPNRMLIFKKTEGQLLKEWLRGNDKAHAYFYYGPSLPQMFAEQEIVLDRIKLNIAPVPRRLFFPLPEPETEEVTEAPVEVAEQHENELTYWEKKLKRVSMLRRKFIKFFLREKKDAGE